MTTQQLSTVAPGTDLLHYRYGPVRVEKIISGSGAVVQPHTDAGKRVLQMDSGSAYGTPVLVEDLEQVDFITAESVRKFHP